MKHMCKGGSGSFIIYEIIFFISKIAIQLCGATPVFFSSGGKINEKTVHDYKGVVKNQLT